MHPILLTENWFKGKPRHAEASLNRLRDREDVHSELMTIQKCVNQKEKEDDSLAELWRNAGCRRAFLINVWLICCLEFSWITTIRDYAGVLFERSGFPMDKDFEMAITYPITIVAACMTSVVVDKLGRKSLLVLSSVVMVLALFMMSVFYILEEHGLEIYKYSWVPLLSLILFNIARSAGLMPLKTILMSEYYPLNMKATAASAGHFLTAIVGFLTSKLFQVITDMMGFGPVIFMGLFVFIIGVIIMYCIMSETKNMSLLEIEQLFQQQSG